MTVAETESGVIVSFADVPMKVAIGLSPLRSPMSRIAFRSASDCTKVPSVTIGNRLVGRCEMPHSQDRIDGDLTG